MIDKTASDSYDLKIFSVDKYESFTLNLTCIDTTKPVKLITESVHWERLYYNSAIPMTQNTNTITFKLENDFIRMKVRCEALRNNKILFTREFLFTEKRRYEIVPFVTQSPSFEYHGGRLIHSDPAKFYIDGNNFIYFSVHFTDIGKRVFIFNNFTCSFCLIYFGSTSFFRGGSRAAATSKMERFVIIVNGF